MLLETMSHVLSLDFGWLGGLLFGNPLWFFLFACLGVFIYGKGPISGAIFVGIYLFATFDFASMLGWVFRKGIFWAPVLVFLALTAYDSFFGNSGSKLMKRPWFAGAVFYLGLVFINYFIW